MAELKNFKLPDVGEGLTEADIVRWHVQPGDTFPVNQIIVEIETAKAVVELPSPYAGVVADLLVPEGESVDVGTPIIAVQVGTGPVTGGNGTTPGAGSAAGTVGDPALITTTPADGGTEPGMYGTLKPKDPPAEAERQAVLVGYGVKLASTKRRARKPVAGAAPATAPVAPAPAPVARPAVAPAPARAPSAAPANGGAPGLGKPPVRQLA